MALLCRLIGHRPVFVLVEGAKLTLTARCIRCNQDMDLGKYETHAHVSEELMTSDGEELPPAASGEDSSMSQPRTRVADEAFKARLRAADASLA
jgi:hypothetical protein